MVCVCGGGGGLPPNCSATQRPKPPKIAFIFLVDAVFSSTLKKAQILHYFLPTYRFISPNEYARPLSMAFKLS